MPVLINYKICDQAPECGGIEVCPKHAFYWNDKTKRPEVDNAKCITCGLCEKSCPVHAILVVKTKEEYDQFMQVTKPDPAIEAELWEERLGCMPGKTLPHSIVITPDNFDTEIIKQKGLIALDIWSSKTVDCRFHSIPWKSIDKNIPLKKLDGDKYPDLSKKLRVKNYPALLILKNGKEMIRFEGYIYSDRQDEIFNKLKGLNSK